MTTNNSSSIPTQGSYSHQPKFTQHFNLHGNQNSRQVTQVQALTDFQAQIMGAKAQTRLNVADISLSYSSNRIPQQQAHMHQARQINNHSQVQALDNQAYMPGKEYSPTLTNDRYRIKSKSGGRKAHQVSQSAGFKQMKHMVNKSYDANSNMGLQSQSLEFRSAQNHSNLGGSTIPQSQSPTNFNLKLTNMNVNGGGILQQFHTIQATQQSLVQKRNHSFGAVNQGLQRKQQPQYHSIDNRKQLKAQSRGNGTMSGLSSGEVPNSRGSRFITSNNKRINLSDIDNSTQPQDPRRILAQVNQDLTSMTSSIKANLLEGKIGGSAQMKPATGQRPQTSFGYQSFLDKQYNTANPGVGQDTSMVTDEVGDQKPSTEQNGSIRMESNGSQQKALGVKKGERNENLRSFLRKSLDPGHHQRKQSDNVLIQSYQQPNSSLGIADSLQKSGQPQRIKRKRDYSKVIGVPHGLAQQYLTIQQNSTGSNSPQKSGKTQGKKNQYQEQINQVSDQRTQLAQQLPNNETIQPSNFNTIDQDKNIQPTHQIKQDKSATHSRSNTSHKLVRPTTQGQGVERPLQERFDTIQQEESSQPSKSRSEERPASKYKNGSFNQLRASITHEVTTQQQEVSKAKVDNCVSKFAFATKTGFSPSNPYKVNQDSFLAMPHLGEYRRTHFFAVCDGHGVFGKEVSEYVKTQLGQRVEVEIKQIFDNAKQMQRVVDSNEVKDALATSFGFVTQQLYTNSGIDIYFSGSTCVSILIVGNKVFCANVGDSRAVLAREMNGQLNGYPLNRDHKANEPDEEKRIIMNGGRIESFKDASGRPMGPLRVWHLNENIPGLAMTRSFGDHAAAEVGVIAEPEILEMNLTEDDKFLVIASDGVWEFLTNDEVVQIVEPHYKANSAEKAAESLIRESLKKWKSEENVVDDITCIIIFLSIQ